MTDFNLTMKNSTDRLMILAVLGFVAWLVGESMAPSFTVPEDPDNAVANEWLYHPRLDQKIHAEIMPFSRPAPSIRWQFDGARASQGTNWCYGLAMNENNERVPVLLLDTNSIELGYRSDGVVLWRVPPEAR